MGYKAGEEKSHCQLISASYHPTMASQSAVKIRWHIHRNAFFFFFILFYPLYTIVCPLSLSSPLSTGEPCPLVSVNWRASSFPFRPVLLPPPLPSSPSPSPSLPSIGRYRELPLLVSSLLSFRLPPSSFPSLLLGSSHRLVPCGFCLWQVIDWGLEEERYSFLSWCLVFFVFCL